MIKFMQKIPAGTFIVPMLVSALFNTFAPTLFDIGGVSEVFFSGGGMTFIVGALTFSSGIMLDIRKVGSILKHHGVLFLAKIGLALLTGYLAITFLEPQGLFGISTVAFVVAIASINPAIYLGLVKDFGTEHDSLAFSLAGLFSIPAFPLIIYAISGGGEVDLMPIFSILLPLFVGMTLGNLDPAWRGIFGQMPIVLLPLLGWNIGQGIDFKAAFAAGFSGILLALIFYIVTIPTLFGMDKLLKKNGIIGLSLVTVAGASAVSPGLIAVSYSEVAPFAEVAATQILTVTVLTSLVTPILVNYLAKREKVEKNLTVQ